MTADDRVRAVLYPLDGVGLDKLVDAAALLTRVDRKYVLPVDDALTVLAALAPTTGARVLEIDGARSAAYESVYFDTPDLASFRLTATRRRRRFKVRTRTYLDSGASFLEVKTRAARGTTLKQRVAHDGCPTALGADRTFVGRTLAAEGIEGVPEHALAPGLVSRYRRTTLLLPGPTAPRAPPSTRASRGSSTSRARTRRSRGPSRTWWSSRPRAAPRRPTSTACCGGTATGPSGSPSTAPVWRSCAPTFPTARGAA